MSGGCPPETEAMLDRMLRPRRPVRPMPRVWAWRGHELHAHRHRLARNLHARFCVPLTRTTGTHLACDDRARAVIAHRAGVGGNRDRRCSAMEPTRAPWASAPPESAPGTSGNPLPGAIPPVTRAPWATKKQPRQLHVVIKAEPGWPAPVQVQPGTEPWVPAAKHMTGVDDLEVFLKSEAMASYMSFVLALNKAALGKQIPQTHEARRAGGCCSDAMERAVLMRWSVVF